MSFNEELESILDDPRLSDEERVGEKLLACLLLIRIKGLPTPTRLHELEGEVRHWLLSQPRRFLHVETRRGPVRAGFYIISRLSKARLFSLIHAHQLQNLPRRHES